MAKSDTDAIKVDQKPKFDYELFETLEESDVQFVAIWVASHLRPEDVYSRRQLEQWAKSAGLVPERG